MNLIKALIFLIVPLASLNPKIAATIAPSPYPIFSACSGLILFNASAIPFRAPGTTALIKSAPISSRSWKKSSSPVPTASANGSSAFQNSFSAAFIVGQSTFNRKLFTASASIGKIRSKSLSTPSRQSCQALTDLRPRDA